MYVKHITLYNFKSYGGSTKIDKIKLGRSIYVGSNGSGKSNLFQAIQFVTEPTYPARKSDRLKFHHNGRQKRVSVELLFAECDEFAGEITLRRSMNCEQDRFYFNSKRVSRKEFRTVLEIFGFCSDRSIYFSSPKLINSFVLQSPHRRLESFINSLGLTVKTTLAALRKLFVKMEDIKIEFEKVTYLSEFMETKDMQIVREQHEKLLKYEELSSLKAYLLMLLRQKYIIKLNNEIHELQKSMTGENMSTETWQRIKLNISKLKSLIAETKELIVNCTSRAEEIQGERNDLLGKKERITLELIEVDKNIDYARRCVEEEGPNELDEEIKNLSENLCELELKYSDENDKLKHLTEQLVGNKQARLYLISKMTRQFGTVEERDAWIKSQLDSVQNEIDVNRATTRKLNSEKQELYKEQLIWDTKLLEMEESSPNDSVNREEMEFKNQYDSLLANINDLRRNQSKIEHNIKILTENLQKKRKDLQIKLGHGIFNGCESVNKVIDNWKSSDSQLHKTLLNGYHGMVVDNFSCEEQIHVAVDVAAAKRLYLHIVTDNEVGNAILAEMNEMHLTGEVFFVPLNRISIVAYHYPQNADVKPLINLLNFRQIFRKAMNFVFGHVLLCKDTEVAVKSAKSYRFNCVTLAGDKMRRDGVMSGGFIDTSNSTMRVYLHVRELQRALDSLNSSLEENCRRLREHQTKLDQVSSTLQKINLRNMLPSPSSSYSEEKHAVVSTALNIVEEKIEAAQRDYLQLKIKETSLKNELNEQFGFKSSSEELQLRNVNEIINDTEKKIANFTKCLLDINNEKSKQEMLLNKKRQLNMLTNVNHKELKQYETKKRDFLIKRTMLVKRLQAVDEQLAIEQEKINKAKQEESRQVQELNDLYQAKHDFPSHKVNVFAKIAVLNSKIRIYQNLIASNAMRSENFETLNVTKYDHYSTVQLADEIKLTNTEINTLGQIDLRSKEVFKESMKLLKYNQILSKKFSEFTEWYVFMVDFKNWLEEHVECVIGEISSKFIHYFNMLVPNGRGALDLHYDCGTSLGSSNTEDELCEFGKGWGIGLTASFSEHLHEQNIESLSRGQHTVILISIILAFLSVQDFPFCIMDEIDQHLSDNQIKLLIEALDRMDKRQLLISTHNVKMLNPKDAIYHISFKSLLQCSRVSEVDFNKARELFGNLKVRDESSNGFSTETVSTSIMSA